MYTITVMTIKSQTQLQSESASAVPLLSKSMHLATVLVTTEAKSGHFFKPFILLSQ